MTNFSGTARAGLWRWLSPERSVLILPVFAGLGLSLLVLSAGIAPLKLRIDDQKEVVDEMIFKSEILPLLEQELDQIRRQQIQRQQQLDRLLSLVAGTSELNTFLSELNDLAMTYRVAIITTEPGELQRFTPPPLPTEQDAPPAAGGAEQRYFSGDALLNQGLLKRSAGLTIQAPFPQVLSFLQALESLEVFVHISEMDARLVSSGRQEAVDASSSEVNMVLKLTAYGRQRQSEVTMEVVK